MRTFVPSQELSCGGLAHSWRSRQPEELPLDVWLDGVGARGGRDGVSHVQHWTQVSWTEQYNSDSLSSMASSSVILGYRLTWPMLRQVHGLPVPGHHTELGVLLLAFYSGEERLMKLFINDRLTFDWPENKNS